MRNADMGIEIIFKPCRSKKVAEEVAHFVENDRVWLVIYQEGDHTCDWSEDPEYYENNC